MSNVTVFTQEGPEGIRYDFLDGCRVWVPEGAKWTVRFRDVATNTVVYESEMPSEGSVQTSKRYYVPFEIKVWKDDVLVFTHECDLTDRDVLIKMHLGGLGDTLAWMGSVVAFAKQHKCRLTCWIREDVKKLFESAYPDIKFITEEEKEEDQRHFYAAYSVLVFFDDNKHIYQPMDYRHSGLLHMGADILGLTFEERRPRVKVDRGGRPIKERYVCIASHASGLTKYWNNPRGWYEVVRFLKENGYRVVCIDMYPIGGAEKTPRYIPHGVEDQTGPRSLTERARWLKHADFFVGLSSGLSWLAWAVKTPVVMISGYTEPYNEFYTPYRIINRHVCNGCGNDIRQRFDSSDTYFCPYHKGTDRAFECSTFISSGHVMSVIRKIPGFGVQKNGG